MNPIFGRLAGRVHIQCTDDTAFRNALDIVLVAEIRVTVDAGRRLLTVNLGDYPNDEDSSTDLPAVLRLLDVLEPLGQVVPEATALGLMGRG